MVRLFLFLFSFSTLYALTPTSLSPNTAPGFYNVGPTQYVTDDAGNMMAVWQLNNRIGKNGRTFNQVLQFAYKPVGGDWIIPGNPTVQANVISPVHYSVIDWVVAMDREGDAIVVWRVRNDRGITVVQFAYRPFGGDFTPTGDPNNPLFFLNDQNFSINTLPEVGIGLGNSTILWKVTSNRSLSLFNNVLQAALVNPDGTFVRPGDPRINGNTLNFYSPTPGQFNLTSDPLFFVDKDGNAVVAWQVNNATSPGSGQGKQVVQAVTRLVGSPFETAGIPTVRDNILSPLFFNISTLESALIGSGNAAVFWKRTSNITGNTILQNAFRAAGAPTWEKPPES